MKIGKLYRATKETTIVCLPAGNDMTNWWFGKLYPGEVVLVYEIKENTPFFLYKQERKCVFWISKDILTMEEL